MASDVVPVVIIEKAEYDRLVAAAEAVPVMESVSRFHAAGAVWSVRSIERREQFDEWAEVVIIGTNATRGFKNLGGEEWQADDRQP